MLSIVSLCHNFKLTPQGAALSLHAQVLRQLWDMQLWPANQAPWGLLLSCGSSSSSALSWTPALAASLTALCTARLRERLDLVHARLPVSGYLSKACSLIARGHVTRKRPNTTQASVSGDGQ